MDMRWQVSLIWLWAAYIYPSSLLLITLKLEDAIMIVKLNAVQYWINRIHIENFKRSRSQKIYIFAVLYTRTKSTGAIHLQLWEDNMLLDKSAHIPFPGLFFLYSELDLLRSSDSSGSVRLRTAKTQVQVPRSGSRSDSRILNQFRLKPQVP